LVKYSLKRILELIPTIFVVVFIVFVVTRVIPGDPAAVMLGPQASVEAVEELRESLGLNDNIFVQFGRYLKGVMRGDLGKSYYYNQPVTELISERFPNTLILAIVSIIIGLLVGIPVGVVSATKQYSAFDYISMILALMGISVPIFWLAMMAVLLFSVNLGWLPSVGMGEGSVIDIVRHLILPSLCLATGPTATFARFTRSSMLDITKQDYIKTARSKGLKEKLIIWKHAFKNALPPIITIVGMQFSSLLSGAVLTETIFSWPGLGKLIVDAIQNRDYTLVQGSVVYIAFIYIIVNLVVDICYALLNPKVKASFIGNGGEGK
jgi:peptide/nickel transport system permease protein